MINSAVRGAVVATLTTTLALLPAATAQAGTSDKAKEIEKVELLGVTVLDTAPEHIKAGDSWGTRLELYSEKKSKKGKKQLRFAGDGQSECGAVHVSHDGVTAQCTRVLRLKKGTLTLSDMITRRPHEPITAKTAIIGGTGHYRSAYGDGYITLIGDHVHLKLNVDE